MKKNKLIIFCVIITIAFLIPMTTTVKAGSYYNRNQVYYGTWGIDTTLITGSFIGCKTASKILAIGNAPLGFARIILILETSETCSGLIHYMGTRYDISGKYECNSGTFCASFISGIYEGWIDSSGVSEGII